MSDNKITAYGPLIIISIVHLIAVGVIYGTLTSEMKTFNSSLKETVTELRKAVGSIQSLKESDIRIKSHQSYINEKIKKLESKHE